MLPLYLSSVILNRVNERNNLSDKKRNLESENSSVYNNNNRKGIIVLTRYRLDVSPLCILTNLNKTFKIHSILYAFVVYMKKQHYIFFSTPSSSAKGSVFLSKFREIHIKFVVLFWLSLIEAFFLNTYFMSSNHNL